MIKYMFLIEGRGFTGYFKFNSGYKIWEYNFWNSHEVHSDLRKEYRIPLGAKIIEIIVGSLHFSLIQEQQDKIIYRIETDVDAFPTEDDLKKDKDFLSQFSGTDYWLERKKENPLVWFLHFKKAKI